MSNKKYKDFDSYFAEATNTSNVSIKLYGKDYDIPLDFPAEIILELFNILESGKDEVSDAKQMEMSIRMLGRENVEEWCRKGISMRQLGEIMKWVLGLVMGEEEDGELKKKPTSKE